MDSGFYWHAPEISNMPALQRIGVRRKSNKQCLSRQARKCYIRICEQHEYSCSVAVLANKASPARDGPSIAGGWVPRGLSNCGYHGPMLLKCLYRVSYLKQTVLVISSVQAYSHPGEDRR